MIEKPVQIMFANAKPREQPLISMNKALENLPRPNATDVLNAADGPVIEYMKALFDTLLYRRIYPSGKKIHLAAEQDDTKIIERIIALSTNIANERRGEQNRLKPDEVMKIREHILDIIDPPDEEQSEFFTKEIVLTDKTTSHNDRALKITIHNASIGVSVEYVKNGEKRMLFNNKPARDFLTPTSDFSSPTR